MIGLKENVLIGKLIPAGTGMKRYRDVKLDTEIGTVAFDDEEEDILLDEEDIIFSEDMEEELFESEEDTEEEADENLEEAVLTTEE